MRKNLIWYYVLRGIMWASAWIEAGLAEFYAWGDERRFRIEKSWENE